MLLLLRYIVNGRYKLRLSFSVLLNCVVTINLIDSMERSPFEVSNTSSSSQ
jgi:hypothetical protein